MKTAVVEFLTPDTASKDAKKEYSQEEIFDMSMSNVTNNASWSFSDVLISAPVTMTHILKTRK